MTDLTRRTAAVQRTLLKFEGRPLEWGRFDCARLAVDVARNLGHKVRLSTFGQYKTPAQAKSALARRGFDDLPAAIDAMGFERIAPARCLPGDVIGFFPQVNPETGDGPYELTSLCVWLGNGRVLGFHAGVGQCCVMQPDYASAATAPTAWRL